MPARLTLLFVLCLIESSCAGFMRGADYLSRSEPARRMLSPRKFALDNGLTVLFVENHAQPLVTLDYWVPAGSADEPTTLSGISHFLEHMLFKGTDAYAPSEIDRMVESVGGVWNAATSCDFTHYHVSLASEFIETGAKALSSIVASAKIDRDEADRERRVIVEEYHQAQDNPRQLLFERLHDTAFRSGPYKASVLGTPESLAKIDHVALREYYDRHYAPGACALVVAGDVTQETLLPLLEKTFGKDRRLTQPPDGSPPATRRAAGVRQSIAKDVREAYLAVAFPAPSVRQKKDLYAMDLLASIMGDGKTSRLYRRLREKDRLVTTVGASFPTQRFSSLFIVTATLQGQNRQAVRAAIDDEIRRIAQKGPTSAELKRAKRLARVRQIYAAETTGGLASNVGWHYTLAGSETFLETYLDNIDKVSAGDVVRVARACLDPDKAVEVAILPGLSPRTSAQ